MIEPTLNTNLGIAGATLFIIYMIVRYFMSSLDKKDEYIKTLVTGFTEHVEMCNGNFLKYSEHFSAIAKSQSEAVDRLVDRVNQLETGQK